MLLFTEVYDFKKRVTEQKFYAKLERRLQRLNLIC